LTPALALNRFQRRSAVTPETVKPRKAGSPTRLPKYKHGSLDRL
jgi:hypothetical protein